MSMSLPIFSRQSREAVERREQSGFSSVQGAVNSVKCPKCDEERKEQDDEQKKLFMQIEGLKEKLHSERRVLEKKDEEIRRLNYHLSQSEEEKEQLRNTNQTLNQQVQESLELKMKNENLQKEVEELRNQIQISAQQNKYERYHWKKLSKTQKRHIAKLIDGHKNVMDENGMLKVQKANLVDVLMTLRDSMLRRNYQLEEQLVRNRTAEQACMVLGYSCEIVEEAVRIWERRYGYSAVDLMMIITEDDGQGVNEERQFQRQPERLEGAVGGQDEND